MPYKERKVYYDGSHYIAIPRKKTFKKKEEIIRLLKDKENNSNMCTDKSKNTPTYETVIDDDLLLDEKLMEVDIAKVLSAEDIAELESQFKPNLALPSNDTCIKTSARKGAKVKYSFQD